MGSAGERKSALERERAIFPKFLIHYLVGGRKELLAGINKSSVVLFWSGDFFFSFKDISLQIPSSVCKCVICFYIL